MLLLEERYSLKLVNFSGLLQRLVSVHRSDLSINLVRGTWGHEQPRAQTDRTESHILPLEKPGLKRGL